MPDPTPPVPAPAQPGAGAAPATPPTPTPPAVPPATPPPAAGAAPTPGNPTGSEGQRVVPETYTLALPDGAVIDQSAIAKISEFAKANKLTNAEAQSILNRENELVMSYAQAQQEEVAKKQTEWIKTAMTDPEIGGDETKLKENVELGFRVINRYGTDALKTVLKESGLGNYPEFVRLMTRIGKAMTEDQLILASGKPPAEAKSAAELLYPNQNKTT